MAPSPLGAWPAATSAGRGRRAPWDAPATSFDYFGWTALKYAKYAESADALAEIAATITDQSMY